MVKAKDLPSLSITLSMAETKWIHLREILDLNPTNRPVLTMQPCISYSFLKLSMVNHSFIINYCRKCHGDQKRNSQDHILPIENIIFPCFLMTQYVGDIILYHESSNKNLHEQEDKKSQDRLMHVTSRQIRHSQQTLC